MTQHIKICGLTRAQDMDAALNAGARYVGLVIHDRSPRHISFEQAAALAGRAHHRAKTVVITVDADDELLARIVRDIAPDMLQLHGSETPQRCAHLLQKYPLGLIKSVGLSKTDDLAQLTLYKDLAAFCLVERKYPPSEMPGGRGLSFDWALLALPRAPLPRIMLSGGLTPDNVREALQTTGADAADVSSGVESTPGLKNEAKIKAFIAGAHSVKSAMPDIDFS